GHRLGLSLRQVRATPVELLVLGQELRPVALERVQATLFRPRLEVEKIRPDARRAGLACRADDVGHELRLVAQPGDDRRHADARLDSRVDELLERAQSLAWRRSPRFGALPALV